MRPEKSNRQIFTTNCFDHTILNMEYQTCRLVLKALDNHKTVAEASFALGISNRTLLRYKKIWDIQLTVGFSRSNSKKSHYISKDPYDLFNVKEITPIEEIIKKYEDYEKN